MNMMCMIQHKYKYIEIVGRIEIGDCREYSLMILKECERCGKKHAYVIAPNNEKIELAPWYVKDAIISELIRRLNVIIDKHPCTSAFSFKNDLLYNSKNVDINHIIAWIRDKLAMIANEETNKESIKLGILKNSLP